MFARILAEIRLVMRNNNFDFLAGKWRGRHTDASRPDQKVGPLGGPFGSTVISKTYFQDFRLKPPPQPSKMAISQFTIFHLNDFAQIAC